MGGTNEHWPMALARRCESHAVRGGHESQVAAVGSSAHTRIIGRCPPDRYVHPDIAGSNDSAKWVTDRTPWTCAERNVGCLSVVASPGNPAPATERSGVEMALDTVHVGFLIRLKAQPGKDAAVAEFLESVLPIVDDEPRTTAFVAFRTGDSEYGIVNAFADDAGRQAHGGGQAGAALSARAAELFAEPPTVEPIEVLASKLPA